MLAPSTNDRIRAPSLERFLKSDIDLLQPSTWKCKNSRTSQILQSCERIAFGMIGVEDGSFLAPSKSFDGTLTVFDPRSDDHLFKPL